MLMTKKKPFAKNDETLFTVFTILMDVQVLLGLVLLVWDAAQQSFFPMYRIEHAVTLIIALAIVHIPKKWKSIDAGERAKKTLLAVAAAAILVVIGITRLPQGW